jgi:hypothetical protein
MKTRIAYTIALALLALSLTACSITWDDAGNRSATLDGDGLAKVIRSAK